MNAAFLISGGGSTARKILDECRFGVLKGLVNPVLVIASRSCDGIANCLRGGIDPANLLILRRKDFDSPEAHARAIIRECRDRGVEFLGQYGYTAKTHEEVIEAFPGMMVNQHPGPTDPPHEDFGGEGMMGAVVHESVMDFYWSTSGWFNRTEATAHRVNPEYDKGVRVGFQTLVIRPEHTAQSLAAELLPLEHRLQVEVIGQFATGTVTEYHRKQRLIPPHWVSTLLKIKAATIARHKAARP